MGKTIDWRDYVDDEGDFELANYLHNTLKDYMKLCLDLGTMLSESDPKRRAFKEQVKQSFRDKWSDIAQAFEHFEILVPCGCEDGEFCKLCGGSRYQLNTTLTPQKMLELAVIKDPQQDQDIRNKLADGVIEVWERIEEMNATPQHAEVE